MYSFFFCKIKLAVRMLPSGATAEGARTVKTLNNYSYILLTASDMALSRKERKIVASCDKLLSQDRSQPNQSSQRLLAGFAASHPIILPGIQAIVIGTPDAFRVYQCPP